MALLACRDLSASYGEITVLHRVTFEVEEGEVVTILGANGAGKSTTLRTLSGVLRGSAGEVWFDGKRIDRSSPQDIARLGVVHVPEGRRVFPGLTVRDNLILGTSNRGRVRRPDLEADIDKQLETFPDLKALLGRLGWTLSGGQQQMVAIARGLMGRPRVLLVDEASLGLAPIVIKQVFKALEAVRKEGTTILLVEQNATMALSLADRGYVLEVGRITLEGRAQSLLADPAVAQAYLGGSAPPMTPVAGSGDHD